MPMPPSAARSSSRDLGRRSAKQTATRSRTRMSQEDNIPNVSRSHEEELDDDVAHDAMEPTKLQTPASPSSIFASVSHSGPHDCPDEDVPPTISVHEDPNPHLTQTETIHAEPSNYFPGGPLSWEWDGPEDFQDIAQNYEPQGELLNEAGGQRSLEQDFDFRGVTTDSPQVQSYFSEQFRGLPFDHPQLPEQSLLRGQAQTTTSGNKTSYSTGDKRKSIVATESDPSGTQGGDFAAKRVAFSPEESSAASEQATANSQAPQRRNGGVLRRASEGPEPDGSRAEASRAKSTAQQEPPVKRSKPSNRRDKPGEKKMALPAGKVFPIQIGSELFRLSGASISSDAPSYFSDFFGEQLRAKEDSAASVKTLYIDRDPITFRDICLHLQGYHVQPRDGEHFVKLFADAQFYSLPRLITQLFTSSIYIQIGDRHFRIPRDIFNAPGDNPNYFSLGFAVFFSTPSEVFPGLDQRGLLRPPSILPPAILNRSADIFAELLQILQGYPVHIRNDEHRAALLRDARYFHLKGLEQKLIPHNISYNYARQQSEIVIRLEDIRQSGISFIPDAPTAPSSSEHASRASPADPESSNSASRPSPAASSISNNNSTIAATAAATTTAAGRTGSTSGASGPATQIHPGPGWIHYARPYVDDTPHHLVLEIGSEATRLDTSGAPSRASFAGKTNDRVSALLGVVASKMNLPATAQPLGLMMLQSGGGGIATQPVSPGNSGLSEERMKVVMDASADVMVDGVAWDPVAGAPVAVSPAGATTPGEGAEEYEAIFEFEGREGRGRARKRRRVDVEDGGGGGMAGVEGGGGAGSKVWTVRNGHWRLRAQQDGKGGMEVVLVAVKIEAFTSEKLRNSQRMFLS